MGDTLFERINAAGRETRKRLGRNAVIEVVDSSGDRLVYRVAGETETREATPPPKKK